MNSEIQNFETLHWHHFGCLRYGIYVDAQFFMEIHSHGSEKKKKWNLCVALNEPCIYNGINDI